MQVNPNLIKNHFKKSMEKYNSNAVVQKELAAKLIEELIKFRSDFDNVLELGCGTGLLTTRAKEQLNFKNYYANDLIDKSKHYVEKIIPEISFICGNAQKIKTSKPIDLIISNAMFQWFKDLTKVSNHYSSMLNKDGIIAFTTFSPDNFCEIRSLTGLTLEYKSIEQITEEIKEKSFSVQRNSKDFLKEITENNSERVSIKKLEGNDISGSGIFSYERVLNNSCLLYTSPSPRDA